MPAKIPTESSIFEPFRPDLVIDAIAEVPDRPGFIRKAVAYNNRHLGNQLNVTLHEKNGYRIVYSNSETIKDTRSFSPDNHKEAPSVQSAVLKTTSDGVKYVLMEISEEDFAIMKGKEAAQELKKYKQSIKSIDRKNNGVTAINGGFIGDSNE